MLAEFCCAWSQRGTGRGWGWQGCRQVDEFQQVGPQGVWRGCESPKEVTQSWGMGSVCLSQDCCNKLTQTGWLKTIEIYSLLAVEARSPKSVSLIFEPKSRCWKSRFLSLLWAKVKVLHSWWHEVQVGFGSQAWTQGRRYQETRWMWCWVPDCCPLGWAQGGPETPRRSQAMPVLGW